MGVPLGELTNEFFRRTRRVSAVMYVIERHVEFEKDGPAGYILIRHACLLHPNARRPLNSVSFLDDNWETVTIQSDPPIERRNTAFFDWADSIFDEQGQSS
jgi:hypothetical protein